MVKEPPDESDATDLSRSGPRFFLAPWQRQQGTEEVKQTKALRLDLGEKTVMVAMVEIWWFSQ